MSKFYEEMKKNFGFGMMRLPMLDENHVDIAQTTRMVDAFLEAGFNYFDTAHPYIGGLSELAIKECLTSRYPRERYLLADKLSPSTISKEEDIRRVFQEQLDACGVEYFDFYLMHAQNRKHFDEYRQMHAYETAFALKEEGKIRHVGFSFHDSAEMLDEILTAYPQLEFVQIQFNYADYEDERVQSRLCYEVCVKHGKPVIVMEPVKGGSLVNLPALAQQALDVLFEKKSNASYAVRFAAGFENIAMVLSGMSTMEQMEDNIATMKDFQPLDSDEKAAVEKAAAVLRSQGLIPCTGCRYCVEGCPKSILIPEVFSCVNAKTVFGEDKQAEYDALPGGKAGDCIKCGKCEHSCPQKLEIRKLLEDAAKTYEQ